MRKYLPTLAELVDRLSILQLKEVFVTEHKQEYAQEIIDIMHDIDLIMQDEELIVTAKDIRAIIVLAQMNTHIWYNEAGVRSGTKEPSDLLLTHSLNGIRNTAKNIIQEQSDGRKDYKVDCLAAEHSEWEISW